MDISRKKKKKLDMDMVQYFSLYQRNRVTFLDMDMLGFFHSRIHVI